MDANERQWEERGLRDAVLDGDAGAWRVLYDRCFDSLYAFVDYRTGHRTDRTDDVVQDCWLIAVKRIAAFDPLRGSFESWLRGIAAKVLRNHWRRWRRDRDGAGVDRASGSDRPRGDPGPGSDLAERIGLVMTSLPERFQSVLQAKYEERLTVTEISRRWGRSRKAIESLLSRARQAFREAYARRDGEP